MTTLVNFAALAVATIFALAAAGALSWISLRVALVLLEPRRAGRIAGPSGLEHGTARVARAFSVHR